MNTSPTPPRAAKDSSSNHEVAARRRFTVRVLSPLFQFADVEVEAGSEAEAAAAATREAARLPGGAWDADEAMNDATAALEVICVADHDRLAREAAENAGGDEDGD